MLTIAIVSIILFAVLVWGLVVSSEPTHGTSGGFGVFVLFVAFPGLALFGMLGTALVLYFMGIALEWALFGLLVPIFAVGGLVGLHSALS